MEELDVHLGASRPLGYTYWPLPEDHPGVEVQRESIRLVAPDGGLTRGLLWTPPTGRWKTAVILSHPRADFSVHYACPLLAAAGLRRVRLRNAVHEQRHGLHPREGRARRQGCRRRDVAPRCRSGDPARQQRRRLVDGPGPRRVRYRRRVGRPCRAPWRRRQHELRTSTRQSPTNPIPFSVVPELDMYNPDNGWRPWPEPSTYDKTWLETYRAAQLARVARHRRDRARVHRVLRGRASHESLDSTRRPTRPPGGTGRRVPCGASTW